MIFTYQQHSNYLNMNEAEAAVERCFVKKVFLESLQKFTGKHLCQTLAQVFSCKLCEISNSQRCSVNFHRTPLATAFDQTWANSPPISDHSRNYPGRLALITTSLSFGIGTLRFISLSYKKNKLLWKILKPLFPENLIYKT